ncbi:MAG: Stk1 family PASTA domain-containing Ser/Thr kinase [Clostridia bacterium]|nr:Stk1 family PASTA domain-containing Ser/Thr kinase [Clostridia bacterium]
MTKAQDAYAHLIGKVIDDRYEIMQVKGIGGMAVVLKARDRVKGRVVAIKMLNDKYSNDTAAIRRFVNESKAIALLSSEHIVDIYDVAFTGKSKYIVMEYIDGITLREYMHRNAPLGVDRAMEFSMQILTALQHAHEKGVVHRDIKPQNIMVQANGRLKVTDFGIAQISDGSQGPSGVAMGTVYYISPEQASGKTTTFSSDIYSVGVMLYEMTTGKLPFEGDTPLAVAMMQVNNQPVRPRKIDPSIPQGLEQIILRAMNKAPERRFRSAKSMLRALDLVRKDKTVVFEEPKDPAPGPAPVSAAETAAGKEEKTMKKKSTVRAAGSGGEKRRQRPTMFPVILGVTTAFLLVAAVAGTILVMSLLNLAGDDASLVVRVPNLVGTEYSEILKEGLKSRHLDLVVTEVNNDVYEKGTIVTQTPAAGQTRKIATEEDLVTVKIEVSAGRSSFKMPDVTGVEHRRAKISLESYGATIRVEEQFSTEVTAGHIIATSPEAGKKVQSGDTVTLYVSKGAETNYSPMINVTGMEEAEAKRKLLAANFVVGAITREYSDSIPAGHVIRQSVEPGASTAQRYTAVGLTVSLGPQA